MVLTINEKNFSHEVLGSSTPVVINFWAPWCGLCRLVNPLLFKFQTEWDGQVKLANINADENLKLANTYCLTTLPTVILVKDGTVLYRLEGVRNRDELKAGSEVLQTTLEAIIMGYSYSA